MLIFRLCTSPARPTASLRESLLCRTPRGIRGTEGFMNPWWGKPGNETSVSSHEAVRSKYNSFRQLLSLNNECLELLASLQEDLQFILPSTDVLGHRIDAVFEKAVSAVAALRNLTGRRYSSLAAMVAAQQRELQTYIVSSQEFETPRLAAWLSEVNLSATAEVGAKAAALGEIKNRLHLPVPDGYVLTVQSYRQFCGTPLWTTIRDITRNVD